MIKAPVATPGFDVICAALRDDRCGMAVRMSMIFDTLAAFQDAIDAALAAACRQGAQGMREAAAQVADAYRAAMIQAATETSEEVMNAVVRTASGIAREIRALPLPGEAVGGEDA